MAPGVSFGPLSMFEPIWLGFVLSVKNHRLWCFIQALLFGSDVHWVCVTTKSIQGYICINFFISHGDLLATKPGTSSVSPNRLRQYFQKQQWR